MKKKLQYSALLLLAGILAFAGCSSPLGEELASQAEGSTGIVKILVDGASEARTLVPTLGTATYQVSWKQTGTTLYQTEDTKAGTEVQLPAGRYDLKVVASMGTTPIAEGIVSNVQVVAKRSSTVSLTLNPNSKGESGTFQYAFDYSGINNVTKAWITLTPYGTDNSANNAGSGSGQIHIALEDRNLGDADHSGTGTGTIAVPAGIYTLDLRLTVAKNNGGGISTDDHTQNPAGQTTVNNQNVDIHKTEIVYIYPGQTTSMDAAKYTFRDADLTKLYFQGTLKLNQSYTGITNTAGSYKPTKLEVYTHFGQTDDRLLWVYTDNDAAAPVNAVTMLNPTANDNWNWELLIPAYELSDSGKSLTALPELTLVFTLTDSANRVLYVTQTVTQGINRWIQDTGQLEFSYDWHGAYDIALSRTIRRATFWVNDAVTPNSTDVEFRTESYNPHALAIAIRDNTSWYYYTSRPTELLEDDNVDVVSGMPVLVTALRPFGISDATSTVITRLSARYQYASGEAGTSDFNYRIGYYYKTGTDTGGNNTGKLFYIYDVPETMNGSYYISGINGGIRITAAVLRENGRLITSYYRYPNLGVQLSDLYSGIGYIIEINGGWNSGSYTIVSPSDSITALYSRAGARNYAALDDNRQYDGTATGQGTGWELPTIAQLEKIHAQRAAINAIPSSTYTSGLTLTDRYWSKDYTYATAGTPRISVNPISKLFSDTSSTAPVTVSAYYMNPDTGVSATGDIVEDGAVGDYSTSTADARVRLVRTFTY